MTDQQLPDAIAAALTQTTADRKRVGILYRPTRRRIAGRVSLLDLPPRGDDGAKQIDVFRHSEPLSPSQFVFGMNGTGNSHLPARKDAR